MNGESIARAPLCRTCRNMEFAPLAEAIRHGLWGPHAAYMQFRSDHAVPTALLCHYGTHLIMALFTCQSPRLAPYYSVKTRRTDILDLILPEKCKCLLKLCQELNRGLNARHRVSCVCTRHAARHAACSLRLWPGNATRCCMPASWQLRFAASSLLIKGANCSYSDNAELESILRILRIRASTPTGQE